MLVVENSTGWDFCLRNGESDLYMKIKASECGRRTRQVGVGCFG